MRPRRTPSSNRVFRLEGRTEDNDLWVCHLWVYQDEATVASVWELSDDERQAVADGANIRLTVWGQGTPPVALTVTNESLGRAEA